jgi:aspartate racemase
MKPLLGVIGGLGPLATLKFYELLMKKQNAGTEQDYLDVLIYSKPSIPDRTAFITGKSGVDPFGSLLDAGKVLEKAKVHVIAIPCVTAHFFYEKLVRQIKVPIINIVQEIVKDIHKQGIKKAGLLATDGTLKAGLFYTEMKKYGIEIIKPTEEEQKTLMEIIYVSLKRGENLHENIFKRLAMGLNHRGAETVILGCTELSLAADGMDFDVTDPLSILSRVALDVCGVLNVN